MKKRSMRNRIIKLLRILCLIVITVCMIRIGQRSLLSERYDMGQGEREDVSDSEVNGAPEKEQAASDKNVPAEKEAQAGNGVLQVDGGAEEDVQEPHTDVETLSGNTLPQDRGGSARTKTAEKPTSGSGIPGEEGGRLILKRYQTMYQENGDLAGWLIVRGTQIDYPVMQCEDDEYYLHHDFDGNDSKYGCLYVRDRADLEAGTNFVIYGHNMKNGSMFGELDLYLEEDFYKAHSTILFDTLYERRRYQIMAVFRSQVYSDDADVFKYYQFYEAETEEEFADFYENVKELSLYDTGVEASFGDTFLTLSTCAYHVNNGRLAVVAKRVV